MRESPFGMDRRVLAPRLASSPRIAARMAPLSIMPNVEDQNKLKDGKGHCTFIMREEGVGCMYRNQSHMAGHGNSPPEMA